MTCEKLKILDRAGVVLFICYLMTLGLTVTATRLQDSTSTKKIQNHTRTHTRLQLSTKQNKEVKQKSPQRWLSCCKCIRLIYHNKYNECNTYNNRFSIYIYIKCYVSWLTIPLLLDLGLMRSLSVPIMISRWIWIVSFGPMQRNVSGIADIFLIDDTD